MQAISLEQYARMDRVAVSYLIQGLIPRGGRVMLVGPPKEGKSWLALQVALHVAEGKQFIDRDVQKGRVLYLQFDTPNELWHERITKLVADGVHMPSDVHMIHPDDLPRSVSIDDVPQRNAIMDLVWQVDPDLVVIDVLRKIHNYEENDSTAMKRAFDIINVMFTRPPGSANKGNPALLIIHHTHKLSGEYRPKAVNAGRGSGFMAGEVDAIWLMFQSTLSVESRFADEEHFKADRDPATGLWTFPEGALRKGRLEQVLALCDQHPSMSHAEMWDKLQQQIKQTGCSSRATFFRVLSSAVCCHKRQAACEVSDVHSPNAGLSAFADPQDGQSFVPVAQVQRPLRQYTLQHTSNR